MTLNKFQIGNLSLLILLLINALLFQITYFNVVGIVTLFIMTIFTLVYSHKEAVNKDNSNNVSNAPTADDFHKEFIGVLSEIKQSIEYEISIFEQEINRTNQILKEAIPTISNAFKQLESLSHQQQDMISTLMQEPAQFGDANHNTLESFLIDSNTALEQFFNIISQSHSENVETKKFTQNTVLQFEKLLSLAEQVNDFYNKKTEIKNANEVREPADCTEHENKPKAHNVKEFHEDISNQINSAKLIIEHLEMSVKSMVFEDISIMLNEKEKISEMIEHVSRLTIQTDKSLAALSSLSPQIQATVSEGVRSLQFEDLTFQTLESLKNNVHSLSEIGNEITKFQKAGQTIDLRAKPFLYNRKKKMMLEVLIKHQWKRAMLNYFNHKYTVNRFLA